MWAVRRSPARPARFERRQNHVGSHRRAPEDFVSQRVGKSVQDRAAPRADRRLADAARADRRFRIGNVQRGPLHVRRRVENRRRLVVVEALGQRHAVVLVVDPLLADRVADAQHRPAQHLAAEARGWITVPTSATAR